MMAAVSLMTAIGIPDMHGAVYEGGYGHGSSGYSTKGAFGRTRGGARRSMRRAARLAKGKFVHC